MALWLLAACGGGEATPEATGAPVSAATAAQAGAAAQPTAPPAADATAPASANLPGDPKAAILQALRNQLSAGPYRTTTTITMEDGAQTVVGTVIPPDRMQVAMDLGGMKTEMIYIGDKVWSRQGDGEWQVSDRMGTPGAGLLDESMIADSEATITAAALVGPEVVEGVATLLYSFTTDLNKSTVMPMASVMQTKVWIDAATGLIVRQEITDTTAETPSTTVQVVEYDPSITIEAPAE
jgi:outer membrane lipoprotein-sorting protein